MMITQVKKFIGFLHRWRLCPEMERTSWLILLLGVLSPLLVHAVEQSSIEDCPWPVLSSLYREHQAVNADRPRDRDFWWEPVDDEWWWQTVECRNWYCRFHGEFYPEEEKQEKKPEHCRVPDLKFLEMGTLKDLPAPLFRELINELKDYSVSYPTPANVQKYMQAQYLAMVRAKEYQEVWSEALWRHPSLDYTVVRPTSQYASKVGIVYQGRLLDKFLASLGGRDDVAIVGMVSPECIYCAQIGPILAKFKRDYNINLHFINVQAHPEVAVKFGIESVPEVWLAVRDVGTMRIAAGLRSYNVLKEGVARTWERLTGQTVLPEWHKKESPVDLELDVNDPENQYFIQRTLP